MALSTQDALGSPTAALHVMSCFALSARLMFSLLFPRQILLSSLLSCLRDAVTLFVFTCYKVQLNMWLHVISLLLLYKINLMYNI